MRYGIGILFAFYPRSNHHLTLADPQYWPLIGPWQQDTDLWLVRYQLAHVLGLVCGVMSVVVILWTDVQDGQVTNQSPALVTWPHSSPLIGCRAGCRRAGGTGWRGTPSRCSPPRSRAWCRSASLSYIAACWLNPGTKEKTLWWDILHFPSPRLKVHKLGTLFEDVCESAGLPRTHVGICKTYDWLFPQISNCSPILYFFLHSCHLRLKMSVVISYLVPVWSLHYTSLQLRYWSLGETVCSVYRMSQFSCLFSSIPSWWCCDWCWCCGVAGDLRPPGGHQQPRGVPRLHGPLRLLHLRHANVR